MKNSYEQQAIHKARIHSVQCSQNLVLSQASSCTCQKFQRLHNQTETRIIPKIQRVTITTI